MPFPRKPTASTSIELPLALFVLMIACVLPLLNFGTFCARSAGVLGIARDAAKVAARCKTFKTSTDPTSPPAVTAAKDQAMKTLATTPGIELTKDNVQVFVLGVPKKSGFSQISQSTPLASVDTPNYLYQIEVRVTAQVKPLFPVRVPFFRGVPGLTDAAPVTSSSKQFAEHSQGLTQ